MSRDADANLIRYAAIIAAVTTLKLEAGQRGAMPLVEAARSPQGAYQRRLYRLENFR